MSRTQRPQRQGGGFSRADEAWVELRTRHKPVALLGIAALPMVDDRLMLRDALPQEGPPREVTVERVMRHDANRALVALREADGQTTMVEWWRP